MITCKFCGGLYKPNMERHHMRGHPDLCEEVKLASGSVLWHPTIAGQLSIIKFQQDQYRVQARHA